MKIHSQCKQTTLVGQTWMTTFPVLRNISHSVLAGERLWNYTECINFRGCQNLVSIGILADPSHHLSMNSLTLCSCFYNMSDPSSMNSGSLAVQLPVYSAFDSRGMNFLFYLGHFLHRHYLTTYGISLLVGFSSSAGDLGKSHQAIRR